MGSDIDKIISNYLRGELSEEEEIKLNKWLDTKSSNKDQLDTLSNIWKTPLGYPGIVNMDDEQQKIWSRLKGGNGLTISNKTKSVSLTKIILRYAAVIIVFLSLSYVFWINSNTKVDLPVVIEVIERNNPLGQKSRIHLPDGSTVWLNAGSKLSYSNDFNNENRKLHLEGEAYFEVAKNPNIPFEVFTDDLVITALGTSFNVKAFGNKQFEKIALNTGKVKIECLDTIKIKCTPSYLLPGDLAHFSNQTGRIRISEFDDLDPFGWKDGRIVFHHASFNEVIDVLSRWYNVEFETTGSLNQEWNYSTTFENEVLENVLKSLVFSEKIKYEINGSHIEIKL
ncbi:MAG: FecR domain-containing protein [Cyclobacteriaceae bacterium]|nr:FecR domain-containing protein [Cyclobacteriaceae bacterium]